MTTYLGLNPAVVRRLQMTSSLTEVVGFDRNCPNSDELCSIMKIDSAILIAA